ncbi:MAG: glycerol dehydrogenase [Planctomycetaceae bacterium]|nr:glycerol dehydrogenase [Planctomycetaceae bacterium]
MRKILIAPRRYVQGPDVLAEIGELLKPLGNKALILWDGILKNLVGNTVRQSLQNAGLAFVEVDFQGEATLAERKRVGNIAAQEKCGISVAIGGGKVLDVGKGAAIDNNLRIVTVPTIASNDSPTSAASVWYDENHIFQGFECWYFNPDLVLVDSRVIANAPVRSFVAGMGDALSTWIEMEASMQSRTKNLAGGTPTLAATALARLAFDTLFEYGIDAKRDVENHNLTPAVERVIEANTLLSGIGFESGSLATAHAIGNELSNVPACQKAGMMHGEKVAFGVAAQLCLDDSVSAAYRNMVFDFMIQIGLPVTFKELNLEPLDPAIVRKIAENCAAPGSLVHFHPFEVTAQNLYDAMMSADALGRERKP